MLRRKEKIIPCVFEARKKLSSTSIPADDKKSVDEIIVISVSEGTVSQNSKGSENLKLQRLSVACASQSRK